MTINLLCLYSEKPEGSNFGFFIFAPMRCLSIQLHVFYTFLGHCQVI